MKSICILVEHDKGRIKPVTFELLTAARLLLEKEAGSLRAVVIGPAPSEIAATAAGATGLPVIALDTGDIPDSHTQAQLNALSEWICTEEISYMMVAHTPSGMEIGPGLAARISAACITSVSDIGLGPSFSRPVLGGRFIARMSPGSGRTVITVQPGAFAAAAPAAEAGADITLLSARENDQKMVYLPPVAPESGESGLADAQVVVSAGRGFRSTEELEPVYTLASKFHQGVAAGSRPIIDQGFMPYSRQVGITGATVAPKIYLALGISGSTQHIAGMRQSECVIAVNTDPHAAIFRESDIGIVEDVHPFLTLLNQKLGSPED